MLKVNVARRLGIAVIAVIHQPRAEILDNVDQLVLLSRGGILRYRGKPTRVCVEAALPLLADLEPGVNIADVVLDYCEEFERVVGEDGIDIHLEELAQRDDIPPGLPEPRSVASLPWQLWLHIKRGMKSILRDTTQSVTLYGLVLLCALVLGILHRSSTFVGPPSDLVRTSFVFLLLFVLVFFNECFSFRMLRNVHTNF